MDVIVKAYNDVFYERADPRVKDWFFMKTPWPLATVVITYLLLIKLILPGYMRSRKPYRLRTIIKWYNILQIVANIFVSWGLLTSGWTTTYTLGCELPDYSTKPEPMRMLFFMWCNVWVKLLELVETVFFILRKKENQASFLHIYHHTNALIVMWAAVKYVGGGLASFSPLLNDVVHIFMYTYYLLSSEGTPKLKEVLNRHKKWLTIVQIIQFNVMLIHSAQVFMPWCPAPLGVTVLYFPMVIVVYYMFYDFFRKSYLNKDAKKHQVNGKRKHLNGFKCN